MHFNRLVHTQRLNRTIKYGTALFRRLLQHAVVISDVGYDNSSWCDCSSAYIIFLYCVQTNPSTHSIMLGCSRPCLRDTYTYTVADAIPRWKWSFLSIQNSRIKSLYLQCLTPRNLFYWCKINHVFRTKVQKYIVIALHGKKHGGRLLTKWQKHGLIWLQKNSIKKVSLVIYKNKWLWIFICILQISSGRQIQCASI